MRGKKPDEEARQDVFRAAFIATAQRNEKFIPIIFDGLVEWANLRQSRQGKTRQRFGTVAWGTASNRGG
jgi:hypothetical protein